MTRKSIVTLAYELMNAEARKAKKAAPVEDPPAVEKKAVKVKPTTKGKSNGKRN